jgi:hypothetical protein
MLSTAQAGDPVSTASAAPLPAAAIFFLSTNMVMRDVAALAAKGVTRGQQAATRVADGGVARQERDTPC